MVGHAWPVFARFRGGKAILTFAGGIAAIAPVVFVGAVALLVLVALPTRSFAWGARAGVAAVPVVQLFADPVTEVAATGALMTFIGLRFLLDRLVARFRRHRRAS